MICLQQKQLSDFFEYANHIIYAVVIAQSYQIANKILIPISNIQNYTGAIGAYSLILAYFIIVSGWIGYFKSIKRDPYKGTFGNARFVIDLWIVFVTFYLLALTDPDKGGSISDSFIIVLPTLFASYLVWDIVKFYEHKSDNDIDGNYKKGRMKITIVFVIIFFIQIVFYIYATTYLQNLKWDSQLAWDPIFITTSFASVFVYRLIKWQTGWRPKRSKKIVDSKEKT